MKLRLPHRFQAALLAAIASVSFTTLSSGSATAAELNKIITMGEMVTEDTIHGATASTTWVASDGSAVYDFSGNNCIYGINDADLLTALTSAATSSSTYVTVAAWINPTSHGGSIFGYGGQNNGIKLMDNGGALKATTKGVSDFNTSSNGVDLNQWQLVAVTFRKSEDSSKLEIYYMLDGAYTSVVTPTGGNGSMATANPATFGIGTGNGDGSRENFAGSIGGLTVFTSDGMVTAEQVISQMGNIGHTAGDNLAWNGTVGHNVWNTENSNWVQSGAETSYTAGSSPFFGVSAEAKDVVLGTDITADAMTVEGAYTFNTDSGSLNATSLNLAVAGASLSLEGGSAEHKSTIGNITSVAGTAVSLTNANVNISGSQSFRSSLAIGQGATVTVTQGDSMQYSGLTNTITLLEGGELAMGNKRWSVGSGTTIVMAGGTITGAGDGNGALDYHQSGATIRTIEDSTIAASVRLRTGGQTTYFDVAPDKKLTMSGTLRGGATLYKTGAGTLDFTTKIGSEFSGSMVVAEGTLNVSNGLDGGFRTVTVNEGATVDLKGKDSVDYRMRYTLAGGTLTNTGNNTSTNKVQNDQITLTRDSYVSGTKTFYVLGASHGATYLNLNGNTLHKTDSNTFGLISTRVNAGVLDIQGGTIDFNTTNGEKQAQVAADIILDGGNISGKAKYTGDTTLTVKKGVSTDVAVDLNGSQLTLDVADAQTLTMTGAITGTGSLGKAGAGTATLNNSGNNIALSRTIVVDGGTLNYTGSLSVASGSAGNFEVFGEAVAADFDGEGEYAGSGFRTGNATKYYLMKVAEGATVTGMDTITGATRVTEGTPVNSWVGTIDVAQGDSTYYVNKDLDYNNTVMGSATGMAIAKDATLTSAGISAVTSAKVLHGAGTYVAPSGFSNNFTAGYGYGLGANVSLGSDWTGTVVISGTSNGNTLVDFARLANGKLSTVEVKGLTGWTNDWNGEIEENIILTDVGTTLAWSNGAASKDVGHVANFSGKWSGSGTFARTGSNYMDYKYLGDISQWTGKFQMTGGTTQLSFAGAAHEVNAQVARTGGTLNVVADTDVDFKAALTGINDFTVNAGNTVTFASAPGITNLKGAGTIVLDPSKIDSLGSNRSNWTGTVVLTGTKTNLDFGNLTNGSQSTLELKGFTGYSKAWYGTNVQNIKLTTPDGGGVAWNATGAATGQDNYTAIYSGTWSGDGTMTIAPNKLNYTFSGDISQWTGKLQTESSHANTFNLTFTGNAQAINAEIAGQHNTNTMNLVVDTNATFSKNVTANTLTVNAGKTATLQGDGTFGSLAGTGALVVQGGGSNTVTVNGTDDYSGAITVNAGGTLELTSTVGLGTGSFTMDGGTLKLSQERGLTSSTGSRLAFNSGTLDLSGLQVVAGTDYTLASSMGGTVTLGGVNFSLSSPALKDQYELTVQGGNTLVLSYIQSSNELIWDNNGNTGEWNTTDANWHVGKAAPGTSTFSDNADVKFTTATNGQTVTLAAATTAGNITIEDGANISIQNNGHKLAGKLQGSGTYALASSVTALPVDLNVSDSGWTGTVKLTSVSGTAGNDLNLGQYGNLGSKVELCGVTGYFRRSAGDHIAPEIVLSGDGLTLNNGYTDMSDTAKTPTKYYFDGGVSGAGKMEFNKSTTKTVTQHLYFTGDVKGWSGNLKVVSNFNVYANFSGNADTVNAGIDRTGGNLYLEVGDGSTSFTTTFNNAVSATDLTVANNATAAFGQNATLTTTGDVTLNGTLDLGAMTSAASVGEALTLNDGSVLKFSGAAQNLLQVGSFTVDSSSALDMSAITFNRETSTYTLLSSTSAIDSSVLSALTVTGVTDPLGRAYELGLQGNALTLTFSEPPMPEFGNDLGKVMYIGDSITDGEAGQKSWRYSFFKILADEGITQVEEGYFQSTQTSGQITTASYGDRTFTNTHSAHTSARSTQTVGSRTGRYGDSNIMNWLGQSTVKTDGANYTGAVYDGSAAPDTFFVLLGTNDTLSEDKGHMSETFYNQVINTMYGYSNESFDGKSGTFDKMYASMMEANPDAKLVILEIPTWSPDHKNNNNAEDFYWIGQVNQKLHEWADSKKNSNITIVKSDTGIVDVANTEKPGSGVVRMFADGLHPSAQGELLIAGNVAKALGYGGRTMGQERKGAGTFTNLNITPVQGVTVSTTWDAADVDVTGSFTVDIATLKVGNGYTDTAWDTTDVLTITVGDGSHQGVLKVNEAYIKWGSDILYSYDMSQNTDSLRISYITGGDLPSGYSAGYYVWLGDMMIGESLMSSTGATDGVSVAWTGSTSVTMGSVSGTAGAYAPSLGAGHYENADNLYLVNSTSAIIPWAQPTDDSIGYIGLNQTDASGNYVAGAHVTATGATGTGTYTTVTGGSSVSTLYANSGTHTGDVYMLVNGVTMSGSGTYGWIAAHNSNTLEGDASVKVENSGNSKAMLFGTVSGNISGNVYTEVNGGTFASYTGSNRASYAGSYQGNITGEACLVTTGGVFEDSVFGGVHNKGNGYSIGSTLLDLRGGLVKGNVYGGGVTGTVNSGTSVVISGDAVVNGDVYGGGIGGTVNGGTTITLAGGLVRGSVYGGGAGGTVNGDTKVVLKDGAAVAGNIYGMTDTDQGGTVEFYATTGYRSTALVLAQTVAFTNGATGTYASDFNVETVTLAGASQVTLNNLTFTACTMEIGEGSALTLDGTLTLPKTADYSGELILTNGMTLDLEGMRLSGSEESVTLLHNSASGTIGYTDLSTIKIEAGAATYDSYQLSVDSGNNLVLTFSQAPGLIWDGDKNGNWSTSQDDKNWHAISAEHGTSSFETDSNVRFETNATPNLTEDISAGIVTLQDETSVTINGNGHNLTMHAIVADGATLTITNTAVDKTTIVTGSADVNTLNVKGGTTTFAGGEAVLGKITMQDGNGATTLKFSAKEGVINEYSFVTLDMAPKGSPVRWLEVDEGVKVIGTGHDLGSNQNSTIDSGWGVNGGGLDVNGVLDLAGVISFDDRNSSTIKGSGQINTAGLNISNYNTTTIQGGIKVDITSDTGIYSRTGNGTLNLADATLQAKAVDWTLNRTATLTDTATGTTFEAAAERAITVSSALEGSGKLVKTGEGTLNLNAASSYSGGTELNAGTLVAANASALGTGAVNVNGGTLSLTSSSPVTIGSGTIASGATLKLSQPEQFSVTGDVFSFAPGSILDLSGLSITQDEQVKLGSARDNGSISKDGLLGVTLDFGGRSYDNAYLDVDTQNNLVLTFASPSDLVWDNKTGNSSWDVNTSGNWHQSGSPDGSATFSTLDNVTFESSSSTVLQQDIATGNIQLNNAAALTIDTNGQDLYANGTISGTGGSIVKNGDGSLYLNHENTFTGGVTINNGTVQVANVGALGTENNRNVIVNENGTLLLAKIVDDTYMIDDLKLDRGSTLVFSGEEELSIGTLHMTGNSTLDLSNILLDGYKTYTLARVEEFVPSEPGMWKPTQTGNMTLVQFVTMTGITPAEGYTISPDALVSLHYDKASKLLTLEFNPATDGFYWKPSETTGNNYWDTEHKNWTSTSGEDNKEFVNEQTLSSHGTLARSAYFMDAGQDGVEHINMSNLKYYSAQYMEDMFGGQVHDMIVANGEYHFEYTGESPQFTITTLDNNRLSNFVVRGNAKAYFDAVGLSGGENTVVYISPGGEAKFGNINQWDVYSLNNEGLLDVAFKQEFYSIYGGMSHVDNRGTLNVVLEGDADWMMETMFDVGEVMNREGAMMNLFLPTIQPNPIYGDATMHNQGNLVYGVVDGSREESKSSGTMVTDLPIVGYGKFTTAGSEITVQQTGTLQQGSMELGAMFTQFDNTVEVSGLTQVDAGAVVLFGGGGTLNQLALEPGQSADEVTIASFGPHAEPVYDEYHLWIESYEMSPRSYTAGQVTGAANSTLQVQKGTTVGIAGFNEDSGNLTGDIMVGSVNPYDEEEEMTSASLTVNGETNANTITVQDGAVLDAKGDLTANKLKVYAGAKVLLEDSANSTAELAATGSGIAVVELNGDASQGTEPVLEAKKLSNTDGAALLVVNTETGTTGTTGRVAKFDIGDADATSPAPEGGDYHGTLQYGVGAHAASDSGMELTIKDNNVAAGAELKAYYDEDAPQSASVNVVVDTDAAKVVGLSDNISGPDDDRSMSVSGSGNNTAETGNNGLEITGNGDYEYAGKLGAKLDIAYTGKGYQGINGGVDGFKGKVTVDSDSTEGGVLAIMNAASVGITDLTIGANDTLVAFETTDENGTAVVSGTLTAQGRSTTKGSGTASALYGDLTLGGTSMLDVSAAGGQGGLDLFGALTINEGAQLSSGVLTGVAGLGWFEMYDLAFEVTEMLGFNQVDWSEGVDATKVFANTGLKAEEYYVRYSGAGTAGGNGDNVGAVYIYHIPEPTTSTLSLLALMALAARRRRK